MVLPKQSNKLITKLHYQNVPTQQPNPRHLSAPFSACRRLGNPYLCKERLDGEILGIADIVSIAAFHVWSLFIARRLAYTQWIGCLCVIPLGWATKDRKNWLYATHSAQCAQQG